MLSHVARWLAAQLRAAGPGGPRPYARGNTKAVEPGGIPSSRQRHPDVPEVRLEAVANLTDSRDERADVAMIQGVSVRPLRQMPDERGKVMHMLRRDDPWFEKFGEMYFSVVYRVMRSS